MGQDRTTGLTKDVGWEIGAQRTVTRSPEETWRFLTSRRGLDLWLGAGAKLGDEKGARYHTREGTTGEVRSFRDQDRVRVTWRPARWDHDSTVQVSIRPRNDRR